MDIQKAANNYWRLKKVFENAIDGDSRSNTLIRESLTPEELLEIQQTIQECEDLGIHLVRRVN